MSKYKNSSSNTYGWKFSIVRKHCLIFGSVSSFFRSGAHQREVSRDHEICVPFGLWEVEDSLSSSVAHWS